MIDTAIHFVTTQLNQFLKQSSNLTEDIVINANFVEFDGTVPVEIRNKMLLGLVNVERDTSPRQQPVRHLTGENNRVDTRQPAYLNLYLMIAGNFPTARYSEGLKWLSLIISYFQEHPVFDHSTTPSLDPGIERLTIEVQNLDVNDLSTLWGVLGGRYLPSTLYKMRMIVVDVSDPLVDMPAPG